jgi:hypothetical protein
MASVKPTEVCVAAAKRGLLSWATHAIPHARLRKQRRQSRHTAKISAKHWST